MNLRYDMIGAFYADESRHPQAVMRTLGITYQLATPQSMGDQWWFWNCENVPSNMPKFLDEMKIAPHDAIGYGLSEEEADALGRKEVNEP